MVNHDLSPGRLNPVEKAYPEYFSLMDNMVKWRKAGHMAAINSVIASDPGYEVWEVYLGLISSKDEVLEHKNKEIEALKLK